MVVYTRPLCPARYDGQSSAIACGTASLYPRRARRDGGRMARRPAPPASLSCSLGRLRLALDPWSVASSEQSVRDCMSPSHSSFFFTTLHPPHPTSTIASHRTAPHRTASHHVRPQPHSIRSRHLPGRLPDHRFAACRWRCSPSRGACRHGSSVDVKPPGEPPTADRPPDRPTAAAEDTPTAATCSLRRRHATPVAASEYIDARTHQHHTRTHTHRGPTLRASCNLRTPRATLAMYRTSSRVSSRTIWPRGELTQRFANGENGASGRLGPPRTTSSSRGTRLTCSVMCYVTIKCSRHTPTPNPDPSSQVSGHARGARGAEGLYRKEHDHRGDDRRRRHVNSEKYRI